MSAVDSVPPPPKPPQRNTPVVDPKTGLITRPWGDWFMALIVWATAFHAATQDDL